MGIDILKANTDNYEESQNDGFCKSPKLDIQFKID